MKENDYFWGENLTLIFYHSSLSLSLTKLIVITLQLPPQNFNLTLLMSFQQKNMSQKKEKKEHFPEI